MQAYEIVGINVHPETDIQAQELVTYLEHQHCTWHVDEANVFTIYPIQGMEQLKEMLVEIQAL